MTFKFADRIAKTLDENRSCNLSDAVTLSLPGVFYLPKRTKAIERAHLSLHDFHEPEQLDSTPVVWSKERSRMVCVFSRTVKIRWLWLDIFRGSIPTRLRLHINERSVYDATIRGHRRIALRLPKLLSTHSLTIEIGCEEFLPRSADPASCDDRSLGIQIAEIRAAKYWWRNAGYPSTKRRLSKTA